MITSILRLGSALSHLYLAANFVSNHIGLFDVFVKFVCLSA